MAAAFVYQIILLNIILIEKNEKKTIKQNSLRNFGVELTNYDEFEKVKESKLSATN